MLSLLCIYNVPFDCYLFPCKARHYLLCIFVILCIFFFVFLWFRGEFNIEGLELLSRCEVTVENNLPRGSELHVPAAMIGRFAL